MRWLLLWIFFLFWCPAHAQQGSEVYLIPVSGSGADLQLGEAINISQRPGYDNQPWFSPDGQQVIFSSLRDGQADLYAYSIAKKKLRAITQTPTSEFSPRITPDGQHLSCIVVEPDSTQRIWQMPWKPSGGPIQKLELAAPHLRRLGYYAWIDQQHLALFVITEPFSLQVATANAPTPKVVTAPIGRCVLPVPDEPAASFVDKRDSNSWVIKKYRADRPLRDLIPALDQQEDFCWTSEGGLLMFNKNGVLHYYHPKHHRQWQPIGATGLGANLSRLSFDPQGKYLAVVVAEE
ncbi:MAG: TolB family protein [Salibacteraceae bacterium]